VIGVANGLPKRRFVEGRAIGVNLFVQLFATESCLVRPACSDAAEVPPDEREGRPSCEALEREQDVAAGRALCMP
jgi:hypothetical protein